MLIGLLADSHGRAETTALAVRTLREAGAEVLLHLGDLGSESVIDELVGQPARAVLGNCDPPGLARYAAQVGVPIAEDAGELLADGRRVVYTHGHLAAPMRRALEAGADYLCHGHTHEFRDERHGRTRIINPGALHRALRYTVALLDPATDDLRLLELPR